MTVDLNAYDTVRKNPNGAGIGIRPRAWLRLTGRDRATFLNGQVSNDVLHLAPGQGVHACLLNNTGHMLANLYVHVVEDALLIETEPERGDTVSRTLERFLVREKVAIQDLSSERATVTVQGLGAGAMIANAIADPALLEQAALPLGNVAVGLIGGGEAVLIRRIRTPSPVGFDLVVPKDRLDDVQRKLLMFDGAQTLDETTSEILRIEAGIPSWGAELDESVIPLEANLMSAIHPSKGCYMGQEIIARILSRGHTNRSLVGLRLNAVVQAGASLEVQTETGRVQEVGRITSAVESPEAGPIGLGYVRNEFAALGATLRTGDAGSVDAVITALPFVS